MTHQPKTTGGRTSTRQAGGYKTALGIWAVSFGVLLGPAFVLQSARSGEGGADSPAASPTAQIEAGRETYARYCSTCHGATRQGLAEARAAFPEDHQYCERCHAPLNPPQMSSRDMEHAQAAFSLGKPPKLTDANRLAGFGTAGGLLRYISTAMPRQAPATLKTEQYLAVTAFLLADLGLLDGHTTLDLASADRIELKPED